MLTVLASGRGAGQAITSPSQGSTGCASTAELSKPRCGSMPAAATASGRAGRVPPFSAIVTPLLSAPAATTSAPATWRLRTSRSSATT